jgi:hypothetical protein
MAATTAWVDAIRRGRTAGEDVHFVAGKLPHEAGRDLRTAGIVNAQEEHAGIEVGARRFQAHEGTQPIVGEPLHQDRDPGRDVGGGEDQVERLGHKAFDRLDVDPPVPPPLERH